MTAILSQFSDIFVNFPQCEYRNGYIDSFLCGIKFSGVDIDKCPCPALKLFTVQFLGIGRLWNARFLCFKKGFSCLLNGCGQISETVRCGEAAFKIRHYRAEGATFIMVYIHWVQH